MQDSNAKHKMSLQLDFRWVSLVLLILLTGLVVYTKPWQSNSAVGQRKIAITGEAVVKAEPDEFVFMPTWEKQTLAEVTALNDQVVAALKDLGVADKDIKNNASAWEDYPVVMPMGRATEPGAPEPAPEPIVRQLSITITVNNKALAQKVQDYLLTTDPRGSITPYPQFSTTKQKELEDQARDTAIADAKKRAESTAENLDAKIGKVLEVSDPQQGIMPWAYDMKATVSSAEIASDRQSLAIQPGENEFTYTVNVTFELQ